ncbi:hypothetical protein C0J50_5735 [Silurus asotus]|uniref:Uncharacterized protein n=1 Tax=Silurus asotus TaxID=30991 RepID=A0AAD5A5D1_SILAS|nr:hypothetical protein C0J50_5735 [Silurus asotus]
MLWVWVTLCLMWQENSCVSPFDAWKTPTQGICQRVPAYLLYVPDDAVNIHLQCRFASAIIHLSAHERTNHRHRREIAKYKTAASPATLNVEMEELQIINNIKEDQNSYTDQTQYGQLDSKAPLEGASETEELQPGEIMVTWRDGNVSKLYSDSHKEDEED